MSNDKYNMTYKIGSNTKSQIILQDDYTKWKRAKESKVKGTEFISFSFGEIQLGLILEVIPLQGFGYEEQSEKTMDNIREHYRKRDVFIAMAPDQKAESLVGEFKMMWFVVTGESIPNDNVIKEYKDKSIQWFKDNPNRAVISIKWLYDNIIQSKVDSKPYKELVDGFQSLKTGIRKSSLNILVMADAKDMQDARKNEEYKQRLVNQYLNN